MRNYSKMLLNNKYNDAYDAFAKKWKKCRDAVAGRDRILAESASGDGYLINNCIGKEHKKQFATKLKNSRYTNHPGATIQKIIDVSQRKSDQINTDELDESIKQDGDKLVVYQQKKHDLVDNLFRAISRGDTQDAVTMMYREFLTVGRFALLVKLPQSAQFDAANRAQSDEIKKKTQQNPFVIMYKAEQILDWINQVGDDGYKKLIYVKLKVSENGSLLRSTYSKKNMAKNQCNKAIFYALMSKELIDMFDQMDLSNDRPSILNYAQNLGKVFYAEGSIDQDITSDDLVWTSTLGGIDRIPIEFCGGVDPIKPPIDDIVDKTLELYNIETDLAYRSQYAVRGVPWVTDGDPMAGIPVNTDKVLCQTSDGQQMPMISSQTPGEAISMPYGATTGVWDTSNTFSDMFGQIEIIQEDLRNLGSPLSLLKDRGGRETATAFEGRTTLILSMAKYMVIKVQTCLNKMFDLAADWSGVDDYRMALTLNSDLIVSTLESPSEIVTLFQAGLISRKDAITKLHTMDVYDDNITVEQALKNIEDWELLKDKNELEKLKANQSVMMQSQDVKNKQVKKDDEE